MEEIKRRIINVLHEKKEPLSTEQLIEILGVSKQDASRALFELLREGVIEKTYTEDYDPTRPFDTASWRLVKLIEDKRDTNYFSRYAHLVLAVPFTMHKQRAMFLNKYEAVDFFDAYSHVVNVAEKELRVMCPIIDEYSFFPLLNKIAKSSDIRIRILTELKKSEALVYLKEVTGGGQIEVLDVAIVEPTTGRKIFGIHAKLIIADSKVALLGTFNLSRYHYLVNLDLGFLIHETSTVKKLVMLFDELWNYVLSKNK